MADEAPAPSLHAIPYLRLFPWLRLFRCPASAADPKRLLLAAIGLLLLHAGWLALDRSFARTSDPIPDVVKTWLPGGTRDWGYALTQVSEPAWLIASPFFRAVDPRADARTFTHALLAGLWAVVVWGLIGGAIARVAVVGVTKGERVGLGEAVRFAWRMARPLVGTPLIPLIGVALVGALVAAFGLLYRIPGEAGAVAAGLLAFLPLLGGLVLTLIVVGLAAAWPLMPAAVAAEAQDGFDAMSRTYAYVHQRPWHYAGYLAIAGLAGSAGYYFVDAFARLLLTLTDWALTVGGPASTVNALYGPVQDDWVSHVSSPASAPFFLGRTEFPGTPGAVPGASKATAAHGFWLAAVALLARSWLYSYFWTAATAIYLLLRRDVDGTPWGTIAYDGKPSLLSGFTAGTYPSPSPGPIPPEPLDNTPTIPAPPEVGPHDPGEVAGD